MISDPDSIVGIPGGWPRVSSFFRPVWVYRLIRWSLAAVFLYSGVSKLTDTAAFAAVINAYGLVPEAWGMPVAVLLPLIETVAAVALLWDIRGSLAVITGLLAVFLMILGYGIHMGLDADCGCFGTDDPEHRGFSGLRPAFYRDLVLLAGIVYLYSWRFWQKINKKQIVKETEGGTVR